MFYGPISKQTNTVLHASRHFNVHVLKAAAVKHTHTVHTSNNYIIPTYRTDVV